MTVFYSHVTASQHSFKFIRILGRWKGSIYKLIWKDMLIFIILFLIIRYCYQYLMPANSQRVFERVSSYIHEYTTLIPEGLILGYYLQLIFTRWYMIFDCIPMPDTVAFLISSHLKGHDERSRIMRRTIVRYMTLSFLLVLQKLCPSIKRRFPTTTHLTKAGFFTKEEQKIFDKIDVPYIKYSIVLIWAANIIVLARREGRIYNDFAVRRINFEINAYRMCIGRNIQYCVLNLTPFIYTQSITIIVYLFVLFSLFGKQFLLTRQNQLDGDRDIFLPFGAIIQFFLYVGWLKVAEVMINPLGDDEDDWDLNLILDRNMQMMFMIVDEMHADHPELTKDIFFDEGNFNFVLPYTGATMDELDKDNAESDDLSSTKNIIVSGEEAEFMPASNNIISFWHRKHHLPHPHLPHPHLPHPHLPHLRHRADHKDYTSDVVSFRRNTRNMIVIEEGVAPIALLGWGPAQAGRSLAHTGVFIKREDADGSITLTRSKDGAKPKQRSLAMSPKYLKQQLGEMTKRRPSLLSEFKVPFKEAEEDAKQNSPAKLLMQTKSVSTNAVERFVNFLTLGAYGKASEIEEEEKNYNVENVAKDEVTQVTIFSKKK